MKTALLVAGLGLLLLTGCAGPGSTPAEVSGEALSAERVDAPSAAPVVLTAAFDASASLPVGQTEPVVPPEWNYASPATPEMVHLLRLGYVPTPTGYIRP